MVCEKSNSFETRLSECLKAPAGSESVVLRRQNSSSLSAAASEVPSEGDAHADTPNDSEESNSASRAIRNATERYYHGGVKG
jgi:hypothetical protein